MKTKTFPNIPLPISDEHLPVEVTLLHQLGIGAGTQLIYESMHKQGKHSSFIDELDEPSTKIGDIHFKQDDQSSLYTFAVEKQGHPFHRHQGNRTFTAISGSGGTLLRFSLVTDNELTENEDNFINKLHHICIPPDCMFTVRFGGNTWHQFLPLSQLKNLGQSGKLANKAMSKHPTLFAVSCHQDELSGVDDEVTRQQIKQNKASIPSLTEVLPESLLYKLNTLSSHKVQTTHLALRASPFSFLNTLCTFTRHHFGMLRLRLTKTMLSITTNRSSGYILMNYDTNAELNSKLTTKNQQITSLKVNKMTISADSLLNKYFVSFDYEDGFAVELDNSLFEGRSIEEIMARVLEGFIHNSPNKVTGIMKLRNALVKPLQLRTSSLGCPVSSLLDQSCTTLFANKYPVLASHISQNNVEVLLGADDKHLRFRSCVMVEKRNNYTKISLSTRVKTKNWFGKLYMWFVSPIHIGYIEPAILRSGVGYAINSTKY